MTDSPPDLLPEGPFRSASEFESASSAWREVGETTGDSQYLVVAQSLDYIYETWIDSGHIPTDDEATIRSILRTFLPEIKSCSGDRRAATATAVRLRNEIVLLLNPRPGATFDPGRR